MITEAIVLAGGLGTRLKSVVADLPKSLAPVAGKPFLEYLLGYAQKQGIQKFVFALGYKTALIEQFVTSYLPPHTYRFSVEEFPLGTGGAIYKACMDVNESTVIVLNADTFFAIDFSDLAVLHQEKKANCSLGLKPMKAFDRYGMVELNEHNLITGFSEKKYYDEGLINGGVYALEVKNFLGRNFPTQFSFEQDYLEKSYNLEKIAGFISDEYFIDIGIPEDFARAQRELPAHFKVVSGR